MKLTGWTLAASLATTVAQAGASHAGEVRIMWYSDGNEGAVIADLLDRFMAENPDIRVVLDQVAYQVIKEQLPVQLAAGEGPDIARMTDIKALAGHYLDLTPYLADPDYWRTNYGAQLDWMRSDGSEAIPGFMTQITLTGGYANATLFEQAGVALPDADASLADWVAAADQVRASQGLEGAFGLDRSGHRLAALMIADGAHLIGADGAPAPLDDAGKAFIAQLVDWTANGQNLRDVWVSAAGASYRPGVDEFINATIPYYYAGSWQIPNLSAKIGDGFDWVATGTPCGPGGCAGIPGGAALVAVKYTKNPEDVARVMDYLSSEAVIREFSERSLFLPAHAGVVAAGGLDFQTDDPQARAALEAFVAASAKQGAETNAIPAWAPASDVYAALTARISQVMAGEMGLDDAYARIDADIADAMTNKAQ